MWPKNIVAFRIASALPSTAQLAESLTRAAFQPCGALDMRATGFVPAVENGDLVHSVNGYHLLTVRTEERMLPGSVINKALAERITTVEEQQGHPVGRKQKKELKNLVIDELMPKSFTKHAHTHAYIDPHNKMLLVAVSSQSKALGVAELLGKVVEGLDLRLLKMSKAPAEPMTSWLAGADSPGGFTVDRDCDLVSPEGAKARFRNKDLDIEEIKALIADGMQAEKLAMTWNDRISFAVTKDMHIRGLKFLDIIKEQAVESGAENAQECFDADFAIMAGELQKMLPDIVEAFGGEIEPEAA